MGRKHILWGLLAFCMLATGGMTGCQTGTAPAGTATENRNLAPQRVDVRGRIIRSQYDQGQVVLEVEGVPSPETRYNRAYVLVQPTTQIADVNGRSIGLSELRMGQNVAILMRAGGRGNLVGVGVARRVWVEEN